METRHHAIEPPEPVRLIRIRPERRERRFYRLEIVTDFFGTILLRRCWGRIGTDGRQSSQAFADGAATGKAGELEFFIGAETKPLTQKALTVVNFLRLSLRYRFIK